MFGYSLDDLIDTAEAIIVDVEATPTRISKEVDATETMVERDIDPHIPVWDKARREDGSFSRQDFVYDKEHTVQNLRRLAKLAAMPPPGPVAA
jgi:hypothetical protein